jgi:hypothetical protein
MRRFHEASTRTKVATMTFVWLLAIYMLVGLLLDLS